ncbi:MAG: hypothetical protein ABI986_00315 [Chloroflexota bacterium]
MTMLNILDTHTTPHFDFRKPVAAHRGLHRLFAAAIVNDQFRETLLSKPEEALANGYLGQTFPLTDQEKTLIQSIRADTLTDLAQKVNRALKGA